MRPPGDVPDSLRRGYGYGSCPDVQLESDSRRRCEVPAIGAGRVLERVSRHEPVVPPSI